MLVKQTGHLSDLAFGTADAGPVLTVQLCLGEESLSATQAWLRDRVDVTVRMLSVSLGSSAESFWAGDAVKEREQQQFMRMDHPGDPGRWSNCTSGHGSGEVARKSSRRKERCSCWRKDESPQGCENL